MPPAADAPLTDAYLDPAAFLRRESFHRSVTFTPSYLSSAAPPSSSSVDAPPREFTTTYAVAGFVPPSSSSSSSDEPPKDPPTVVWLNGLGHHRLAAMLFDGLFASRGVRLITLDRPGAGRSTPCPLGVRVKTAHEALLAVLEKEGVSEFSLLSHSNGVIYALYSLLHFPPASSSSSSAPSPSAPRILSWTLSSPYVPPWHSSHLLLSAARYIPPSLTSHLGGLATGAQRVLEPFAKSAGWSAGVSGAVKELGAMAWGSSAGFVSPGTAAAEGASAGGEGDGAAEPPTPTEAEALAQRARFRDLNAARPRHKRLFGGEFYGPSLFGRGMKVAMREGLDGMGQEALICLRQGEAGGTGAWFGEEVEDGAAEGELLERAFKAVKERWAAEGREAIPMRVVYGKEDGLVPAKGRAYLRCLLVDQLGLVDAAHWTEVDDAAHDDDLGLSCVIEPYLEDLLAIHAAAAAKE
ncbi:hypothetical protein JCM8097_005124 [Rhodosporidiobolus ruineniae]